MNDREALEKIRNISEINDCTCFYEDFKNCDNCDVKEGAIELKYAPRKCEYFCMGDCCLPDTNRSCGTDKDNCEYYNLYAQLLQLKAENEQLTQKLKKAKPYIEHILYWDT